MAKRALRLLAGSVVAAVSVAGCSALARADGPHAPWFPLAPARASISAALPLSLTSSFLPFWHYADGLQWAQYNQWRVSQSGVLPIYAARPATPLPGLASHPDAAPHPVALAPVPDPAAREPDPMEKEPDPVEKEPDPVEKEPDPVEKEPDPVEKEPDPVEKAPDPMEKAPTDPVAGPSAEEQELLRLVNLERSKAGLPALTADKQLAATARAKSQDMATEGYFSHDSPRLGSPFEQMKAAGISYRTAAENIAGNGSVAGAHTSLMNSPGHRANILNPRFSRIGIGIIRGGPYGLMVTQQFTG